MTTQRLSLTFPLNLSLSFPKKTSLYLVLLLISFLAFSLLIFYLFQVERLTKESYLVKTYNQEIKALTWQNLALEKEQTELSSLENVEEKIRNLNFVKVSEVKYIPIYFDYLVKGMNQ